MDLLSLAAFGGGVGWICRPWQHLGEGSAGLAFGREEGWISRPWQHLGEGWAGFAVPGSIWERGGLDLPSLAAFGRGVGWIGYPWQHLGEGWAGFAVPGSIWERGPSERPLSRIRGGRAHRSDPYRGSWGGVVIGGLLGAGVFINKE